MNRARVAELLAAAEPRLRRRWLAVMTAVRDRWTEQKLAAALEASDVSDYLADIGRAAAAVATELEGVHRDAATAATEHLTAKLVAKKLDVPLSYDATNTRAVDALGRERARFVGGLTDEQRQVIVDTLMAAAARGANPREAGREVAALLRNSIGLTQTQAEWVRSYQRRLETLDPAALRGELRDSRHDGTVASAIENGKPLTREQIAKMVGRFADRALAYRGEVIARTETMRAVHQGQEDGYDQQIEAGNLDPARVEQRWHAGRPPRTRESHAPMNNQTRKWGEAFTSGAGNSLRYPGDPEAPAAETINCRCSKSIRILPVAAVAAPSDDVGNDAGGGAPPAEPPAPPPPPPPGGAGGGGGAPPPTPPPPGDEPRRRPSGQEAIDAHDAHPIVVGLAKSTVTHLRELGADEKGFNTSYRATLENDDGTVSGGIWKPTPTRPSSPNVPMQAMPLREKMASVVAGMLGVGDLVPPVALRHVTRSDGATKYGSMALEISSDKEPTAVPDEDAVARMRVFDAITGNRDRHKGNVRWRGGTPVLIDHGLIFPNQPPDMFQMPASIRYYHTAGPLPASVAQHVQSIDEAGLVDTLLAGGIGDSAILHTLYRLAVIKKDPQLLATTSDYAVDQVHWESVVIDAADRLSDDERQALEDLLRSRKSK